MKQWFDSLTQREQLYLLICGGAIVLYLLLVAVWQPPGDRRSCPSKFWPPQRELTSRLGESNIRDQGESCHLSLPSWK